MGLGIANAILGKPFVLADLQALATTFPGMIKAEVSGQ
jgi:hypothetical protein